MERYLIINADDFGLTAGVSRGIIRAHQEGILTSTTFMVNFPWASEMALMLREAPDLGVGIHLNITTGTPVRPPHEVTSLVDRRGQFTKSLWNACFRMAHTDVVKEWSAQVEKGATLLGRTPDHLDTHRYLQGVPALAEAMVEVARAYRIPAVRCLYPGTDLMQNMYPPWSPVRLLVGQALRASLRVVARSGLSYPDGAMVGDFDLAELLTRLERIPEGVTELVTHPGLVDDDLQAISSLQSQREVELAALTAPASRARLRDLGLSLVNFRHFAH